MRTAFLPVIIASLCLSACNEETSSESAGAEKSAPKELSAAPAEVKQGANEELTEEKPMTKSETLTGTIVYKEMEGGFYALITKDGGRFTLHGIKEKYRQNGLVVKVTGKQQPDLMTITQFGTVFQVEDIVIVDDSKVKPIQAHQ
tara:strand:- start:278 stop:712 length:435 start_codon:yes stop_codon:yes gene_type:complete